MVNNNISQRAQIKPPSKTKMRKEANRRLGVLCKLGLMRSVRAAFREEKIVHYSHRVKEAGIGQLMGVLYTSDCNPMIEDAIRRYEENSGNLVYFATLTDMEFGKLLEMFYVSQNIDDWDENCNRLYLRNTRVYSVLLGEDHGNIDAIGFRGAGGGIIRTY